MEGQTNRIRVKFWTVILTLSLSLNAFYLWNHHYDAPDVNFYSHELRDAYFVTRHVAGEVYVIEHSGHRYTAKCQDTLTWLDGVYSSARSMGDGCTYISSLVGKSIAEGMMRKEGDAIVYEPWEQSDTVQTADILTIIADETK